MRWIPELKTRIPIYFISVLWILRTPSGTFVDVVNVSIEIKWKSEIFQFTVTCLQHRLRIFTPAPIWEFESRVCLNLFRFAKLQNVSRYFICASFRLFFLLHAKATLGRHRWNMQQSHIIHSSRCTELSAGNLWNAPQIYELCRVAIICIT